MRMVRAYHSCWTAALLLLAGWGLPFVGAVPPADAVIGTAGPDLNERVQTAATQALADAFPEIAHRLTVDVLRLPNTEPLPTDHAVRVHLTRTNGVPRGRVQAEIEARPADGPRQSLGRALLQVAHFDSVMVPLETLRADDAVASDAVVARWVDVTRFSGTPLRAADYRALQREGRLYAARYLRADRTLRAGDLRPAHLVTRGDAVNLQYRRPQFTLTLRGTARDHGYADDIIRVYVPDTGTMYRARITGPGAAAWVETL